MHYHIYCNTKTMNTNHDLAIQEFKKRLSAYCEITLHTNLSLSLPKDVHSKNHHFIFLQTGTSNLSSEEFANCIHTLQHTGKSTIHVFIGYDENTFYTMLSSITDYEAPICISLTGSSLSNETKTVLFYEQLYRGYTILQGKTYHK